jgi:ATP/maltotriose-dependent transcriptional regulator MalT/DNA-binding SARP family transcriptional activator
MGPMKSKRTSLGKTTRPALAGILPRPRLFGRLDAGRHSPVTWVSGPPGSGKTTALVSYVDQAKVASLWYQMDAGDADVATFFFYLKQAGDDLGEGEGEPLPLLTPEYHAGLPAFTRRYFQILFSRLEPPFVVVFDGYQDVPASSPLHDVLRDAVREMPPGGALVMLSRGDPPANFARLRAHGSVTELGWSDLQLDRDEIAAIARERGVELPREALDTLAAKTEGWAAGVVLLLEQSRRAGSISALPDFSTRQVIFDYLAGEIFQATDPRTQAFLLKTALAAQMTAATAEALTGEHDAEPILAGLHRNNYFVTLRKVAPAPVYQYHPMFREFLLARAEETMPADALRQLRGASAALMEEAGYPEDAVELLLDSRDWESAARLVETYAKALVEQGRGETVLHWHEALPKQARQRHPWVVYWAAASQLQPAPREARLLYEQAYELFGAQGSTGEAGALRACSGAMYAILYELDDFSLLDRWIAALDAAVGAGHDWPEPELEARIASSMFISLTLRQPHRRDIGQWIERGVRAAQRASDPNLSMFVCLLAALTLMWTGLNRKAFELIESMRQVAQSPGVSPFSLTTLKNLEAMHAMFAADGDRALTAMREGLEIAHATGAHTWMFQLLVCGYGGALGSNNLGATSDIVKQLEALSGRAGRADLAQYHHFAAWEAMLRNDLMRALQEARISLRMAIEVGSPYFEALARLALAQILAECGDERKCVSHLERLREIVRAIDNRHLEFASLMGSARIALEHGRQRLGLSLLQNGLKIGREFGYTHFLWWCPNRVANVLVRAIEAGIEVDYAKSLVRLRGLVPDAAPLQIDAWPWSFRVQTLGGFGLLKNDAALASAGKAQRRPLELLRVLVALGGEAVSEERITDAMWPRIEGDSAHRSFTSTLHRLRKLLGEDGALVLREGRLSISRRHVWTDVWALEATVTEIESQLARGRVPEPAEVERCQTRLFALYRGPFLAREDDAAWLLQPRERLRARFARALSELGQYWETREELPRARACYEKGIDADPGAEGFYRSLMLLLDRMGRRAEALELFQRCRSALSAQGIEPAPEIRAVYDRLSAAA